MKILALDISTTTGWCIYDTKTGSSKTGTIKCPKREGENFEHRVAEFTLQFRELVRRDGKPDYIAIEQPLRMLPSHRKKPKGFLANVDQGQGEATISAGASLLINQLTGAAISCATLMERPWYTVAPSTWRKSFFPAGYKGKDRQEWKRLAKEQCARLKIKVKNNDEAESVGIAFWAAAHIKRQQQLEGAGQRNKERELIQ